MNKEKTDGGFNWDEEEIPLFINIWVVESIQLELEWKTSKGKSLWASIFHHHALYVGYNITNTFYTAIHAGKKGLGLASRNIFTNECPTMLENASAVTNHYSVQCLTAMFFGYLNAVWARGKPGYGNDQCARRSLVFMSTIGPTMVRPGKELSK